MIGFSQEHVAGARLENASIIMSELRYYLDYHIKTSKTYLHTRMRNRAEQWKNCRSSRLGTHLVLREVHFEEENVQKTTISGKTFVV